MTSVKLLLSLTYQGAKEMSSKVVLTYSKDREINQHYTQIIYCELCGIKTHVTLLQVKI